MSSGSDSDEDFVPGEPEQVSEEDSADDETDKQYDQEVELKAKKRKAAEDSKAKKKRRIKKAAKINKPEPESEPEEEEDDKPKDPEEEKKREDDLWAMFLEGTDTKPKPKETVTNTQTIKPNTVIEKPQTTEEKAKDDKDGDAKAREKRIFEFAGETIVVENNVIKEKFKSSEAPPETVSKLTVGPSRGRSGLSGVLGQLNKKNKLSTLEKSKLDWETYKKEHGIEEEVEKHNKGKDGYLDRQDFLERADVRQFEIERELRMSRRSNR